MPSKLSTTIKKIDAVPNRNNAKLIFEFHKFMKSNGSSERHQNNNLKAIISYAIYLGPDSHLSNINTSEEIVSFLNTKIKTKEEDHDQKWITTWNDYLHRIKHFLRWLHNNTFVLNQNPPMENWITPAFLQIKEKRTKRFSPLVQFGQVTAYMPMDVIAIPYGVQTNIVGTGGSSGSPIIELVSGKVIGIVQEVLMSGVTGKLDRIQTSSTSSMKIPTVETTTNVGLMHGINMQLFYELCEQAKHNIYGRRIKSNLRMSKFKLV